MKYLQNNLLSAYLAIFLVLAGICGQFIAPNFASASQSKHTTSAPAKEEMVMFNTNTFKYHKPSCEWAQRCTRNCIYIPLSEAIRRGGIPCKVCGG